MTTFYNEMKNVQFTYHKNKLTKCLMALALLFSIFTFSGYGANYQLRQQLATQIELLISNNHNTYKPTISFNKASELTSCRDFLINPYKNWTYTLFTYNLLTKVKIDSISRQFCSHKSADHFLQVKTIPQNSDEDTFETFIG